MRILAKPLCNGVFLLLACGVLASAPLADSAKLDEIQRGLRAEQEKLASSKKKLDRSQYQLAQNERALNRASRELERVDRAVKAKHAEAAQLERRAAALSTDHSRHLLLLADELRALHREGDAAGLEYGLGADDWSGLQRRRVYYAYFRAARSARLAGLRAKLAQLLELRSALAAGTAALEAQKKRRQQDFQKLQRRRAERDAALAAVRAEVERTRTGIAMLTRDAARLRGLIGQIEEVVPAPAPPVRFTVMKGRLPWPTEASAIRRGNIRRGVFLGAKPEAEVHSVHGGRVVFSDWIRGYGLLVIIDHGDGYMSLYGNNKVLYKQVGDMVAAGERIAVVGDAALGPAAGLYFEIRHRGKPLDPRKWCS